MSLQPFKHINARSLEEATSALSETGTKAVLKAGGTDILGVLGYRVHRNYPDVLVNIKTVPGIDGVREGPEGLTIGSLTTLSTIVKDPKIRAVCPALSEAARSVASPQIRNMGTLGGNICQETRCWYYRNPQNTFECLRKGGKTCNALTGENRYHSIYGAWRVGARPCALQCPAGTGIPDAMSRLREGDVDGAAKAFLRVNPLPAVTGRVCPHFCEQACNRGDYDEPVGIRNVERFLGDYILDHVDAFFSPPASESRHRVAVVGSGPAGLSAAFFLRKWGVRVTCFEKRERLGGMLAHALPAYRLPGEVVQRVLDALRHIGVVFRTGVEVGRDIPFEALGRDFEGVFLATGAWDQPHIELEGGDLTHAGLDFLIERDRHAGGVPDKRVVVIGGGNVAMDVGVTARRMGARDVTVVSLESRGEMPADPWEVDQALEEGITLMPSWGPSSVLRDGDSVTGIALKRCLKVFDEEGRFSPVFEDGEHRTLQADLIILAVGQRADLTYLGPLGSRLTEEGRIAVSEISQETAVGGIYAGGDAVSGPATVIEAVSAGRRAARAIYDRLGLNPPGEGRAGEGDPGHLLAFEPAALNPIPRTPVSLRGIEERTLTGEDAGGLEQGNLFDEARRCFNCGCVAVSPSDTAPALIVLKARIETTGRVLDAERFFAAGVRQATVLEPGEIVTGIHIPKPLPGTRQTFLKFRLRKAIDFPIVCCAVALVLEEARIGEARIALGAVAPVPLRLDEVERFLLGRELNEATAAEAAEVAVRDCIPLGGNSYKVQITRAMVKRAILSLESA